MMHSAVLQAGLGLRRSLLPALQLACAESHPRLPDFFEIAPENWLGLGGRYPAQLQTMAQYRPMYAHGLSLSIGGLQPIDVSWVQQIKTFLQDYCIEVYSEHLSYTHDGQGYLYDLLPIPMTPQAVRYVAERILQVQDILGQRLVIENVSTYAMPQAQMTEAEFVRAVLEMADCELLLDVNNVYVNHINHGSDPYTFIAAMPAERVRYVHVAGHHVERPDLLIDTHGTVVSDPVWQLLAYTYQHIGIKPTLLERDFHLPTLDVLLDEVDHIRRVQHAAKPQVGNEQSSRFTA